MAWGMHDRGHAWQGMCMTGGVHDRGCVWGRGPCMAKWGHAWQ